MQPATSAQSTISFDQFQRVLTYIEAMPTGNAELIENFKSQEIASFLDKNQSLWKNGVVIDPTVYGDTLLHWAARRSHWIVCAELVKRGESSIRKNFADKTPRELVQNISEEMKMKIFNISGENLKTTGLNSPIECLLPIDPDEGRRVWKEFLNISDPDLLRERFIALSNYRTNPLIDLQFPHGGTLMHDAILKGNLRLLGWCSYGLANQSVQDNEGNTVGHLLVTRYDNECDIQHIKSSLEVCNRQGKSVLHLMASYNRVKMLTNILGFEHFLHSGTDFHGNKYYHDAALHGSTEFLKTVWEATTGKDAKAMEERQHALGFKDYKADYEVHSKFNSVNVVGENILHVAAKAKQIDTLKYLLTLPDMIPLMYRKDHHGKTPLEYAPELLG